MSTRVQKGGLVFRPVAKGKGKAREPPTSARSSVAPKESITFINEFGNASETESTSAAAVTTSSARHDANESSIVDLAESQSTSSTLPTTQYSPINKPHTILPPTSAPSQASSIVTPSRISVPQSVAPPRPTTILEPSSSRADIVPSSSTTAIDTQAQIDSDDEVPFFPAPPPAPETPASAPEPSQEAGSSTQKSKRTRKKSTGNESGKTATSERPKKRTRTASAADAAAEGNESGNAATPRKRTRTRQSSSTPKPRAAKVSKISGDAERGEDLDPTVVTMAELCEDTGQGRISSKAAAIIENHQVWKARSKEQRAQKVMQMELRKLGRNEEADEIDAPPAPANDSLSLAPQTEPTNGNGDDTNEEPTDPAFVDESGQGFDYSQMFGSTQSNVRVRVGPNGETIIDDQSLVVDRQEGQEDMSNYTHVVESDQTKFTNSATYGRKGIKGQKWSTDETELFYHALSQFGENYEMIALMLPGRDRKACKNKFKAEDKKDPARVTAYLKNRIPIDMEALERRTGRDFSGPVPVFKIPDPPPPAPTEAISTHIAAGRSRSAQPAPNATRKRSRSRTAGPEDGVQVLGSIDDPIPDD